MKNLVSCWIVTVQSWFLTSEKVDEMHPFWSSWSYHMIFISRSVFWALLKDFSSSSASKFQWCSKVIPDVANEILSCDRWLKAPEQPLNGSHGEIVFSTVSKLVNWPVSFNSTLFFLNFVRSVSPVWAARNCSVKCQRSVCSSSHILSILSFPNMLFLL